ncbi:MAG TPA: cob(I)yrinic acid a,c-diamide adenosyltransferase [Anaerolineae bacterium]|jgi:cob(I)alamin adenosyltransferase|nr:cob(I)yrinic acid a,c-diamide adenosyltransferase [Anaerolineae bacterium]
MSAAEARGRREAIAGSAVATGKGDDGTTGLLYGGRIAKDDARAEAYGTIDEAVACLGLARAELGELAAAGSLPAQIAGLDRTLLKLQRDLFVAGSELATNPDAWDRLQDGQTRVDEPMLIELEELLRDAESRMEMPREFVVPGADRLSAALEVSRTVVRRAERRVIALDHDRLVPGAWLMPYLNRLADLLWVLARQAEQAGRGGTITVRT